MRLEDRRVLVSLILCLSSIATVIAADPDRRLVEAVRNKDTKAIALLLQRRVDVNTPEPDGATALHWAAYWNDIETASLLLRAGANPNAANDYGATPLWVACASRHTEIVHRLLEARANANGALKSGETVLMRCAFTGDPSAVEALVTQGGDVGTKEPLKGQTALMWAVANQQAKAAHVLISHGAAVDDRTATVAQLRGTGKESTTSPVGSTEFNSGGFTPLLFAARNGDLASAQLLLDAGAGIDGAAADGNSPLVVAAMSGHGAFASFLLGKGADPNASGAGYTALHAAVLRSDLALVQALLAKGANRNVRLTKGTPVPRWTYQFVFLSKQLGATPFTLAAKFGEPEIMRALLAAGADPSIPMEDGTTALMAASGVDWPPGSDLDRRSRLIAPELAAVERENEARILDTVKAAIESNAALTAGAINQTNRAGDTALHGAATNQFKSVVELLVAQGADLDKENNKGITPRQILSRVRKTAGESK